VNRIPPSLVILTLLATLSATGCRSPYRSDQGALFGGLLGAGTGAIIGDAMGNAGAGAAIGAGVGAISGAAIGDELDQIEAQNRAMIEQQLGRQIAAGAVSTGDVVAMTAAGVDDELIVNHVRAHGAAAPLGTDDVIALHQQGVSTRVIKALQEPPSRPVQPVMVGQPVATPVIIEEHHYGPPIIAPPCPSRHSYRPRRRPGMNWGISVHN